MPTRRQQAVANKGLPINGGGSSDRVQPASTHASRLVNPAKTTSTSNAITIGDRAVETIGSRLRKRRRTDSSPTDDSSPAPKRAQSKKTTAASGKRGQASSPPSAALLTSNIDPKLSQQASSPSPSISHQDETLASQLHVTIRQTTPQRPAASARPPTGGQPGGADYNGVIANIADHGETVDANYASQGYDAMGAVDTDSFYHLGASVHLKTQSLPILDNLATQLLNTLAKSTFREILTIATEPDSDSGHAYSTLKSLFDHTKRIYSIHEPFLNPYELGLVENAHQDTIRKANMATFVSSVFGSQDVGFYHLNENFLDTFIVDGNRLLKSQAQLFLDLKTQAYISAVTSGDRSREEILEDLFPYDLDQRLLKRRPGAKQLTPSEADFVQRARNRRKALLEEPKTDQAVKALPEKYIWEDFLKDISIYVAKNFDAIAGVPARKNPRATRGTSHVAHENKQYLQGQQSRGQRRPDQPQPTQPTPQIQHEEHTKGMPPPNPPASSQNNGLVGATDEMAEKAARAADYAIQELSNNQGVVLPQQPPKHNQPSTGPPNTPQNPKPQIAREIRYHFENELHPNVPAPPPPQYSQQIQYQPPPQMQQQWDGQLGVSQIHQSYSNQHLIPNPAQSAPTQVLYERARQAATAKSSPSNRRSGTPSQRRPWTTDEENSLMAGLDRVKGPHWSQILAMFGPGGTINEVLKDRNQVQLKDKARNLKLFFLKSGIEVPYYLQFVTGELKTRAPGQAAKNEAKEKGNSDEDRAHYEGVIALAGGAIQDSDQPMTGIEGQGIASQNGVVPTANMGSGAILVGGNGMDAPIDPNIEDNIHKAIGKAKAQTDAPTDGVGEIIMPLSQEPLQQQQLQHGYPPNLQTSGTIMNGSTSRPPQPVPMQLHSAASRGIASASPNVDPALSV